MTLFSPFPPTPTCCSLSFPCGSKKTSIDVPNDLSTLLRGKGGKLVEIALFSLAEALWDLQWRHQNSLFSSNVALLRGPTQASSSETEGGQDPVRERVKCKHLSKHLTVSKTCIWARLTYCVTQYVLVQVVFLAKLLKIGFFAFTFNVPKKWYYKPKNFCNKSVRFSTNADFYADVKFVDESLNKGSYKKL